MSARAEIHDLIDRLARIYAAERRSDDLNPTQLAALFYLDRANRFSRTPSQVADYLAATRGTVSQTLKSLARKGLIVERASDADKRSISYDVTPDGQGALLTSGDFQPALGSLDDEAVAAIVTALKQLAKALLRARGDRSFGVCHTCRHHRTDHEGTRCALLNVRLASTEIDRICHEHELAA